MHIQDTRIENKILRNSANENEEQPTLLNIEDMPVHLPFVDGYVVQENQQNMAEPYVHVNEDIEADINQGSATNSVPNNTRSNICCRLSFLLAVVFGVADVATDLLLVYKYASDGQYWYCSSTALFIWLPSLMTTVTLFNICEHEEKDSWLYKWFVERKWPLLFIFIFQMSSSIFALKHAIVFKHLNKEEYEEKQKGLLQLQLVDAFNEASPQVTLQMYILFYNKQPGEWQRISILFSLCTITRVATTHKFSFSNYDTSANNIVMRLSVSIYVYMFNLLMVVSRIGIISVAFFVSPIDTTYCIIIHCVLCCIGVDYLKRKLPERQLLTDWFTFPSVSLFNVFSIIDLSTIFDYCVVFKLRVYMLYHALFIFEHIIFIVISKYYLDQDLDILNSLINIGIFTLFYILYYRYVIYKPHETLL